MSSCSHLSGPLLKIMLRRSNVEKEGVEGSFHREADHTDNESVEATFNFEQDFIGQSTSDDDVKQVKVSATVEGNKAINMSHNINEGASKPVTQSAPLHSSQIQMLQSHPKSNPGTIAGLDIDWSHMFLANIMDNYLKTL
ncbi:hypothetical protein ACOSP7_010240 [Xanthoceras sorbifolium]